MVVHMYSSLAGEPSLINNNNVKV